MSRIKTLALYLYIIFTFVLVSCSPKDDYKATTATFTNYILQCGTAFNTLDATANKFKFGEIALDSLKMATHNARLSYKKIEFYIAYRFPEFANANFNGAPLLKLEKDGVSSRVVPPNGLQILDELVFSDEAEENKTKIAAIAKKLKSQYSILTAGIMPVNLTGDELILSARMQLVRIFTLGITGFDTPGSVQGLVETEVTLLAMLNIFKINITTVEQNSSTKKIIGLFEGAISNLHSAKSFEDFDRLTFLLKYLDPLYSELEKLQSNDAGLGLQKRTGWNPKSTSIFAADFLNPYFYTELSEKEDNERLRKLGETLFYDTSLSGNNAISCATCHNPNKAFTDNEVKSLSIVKNETVLRNAPTLLNAVYADRFFYDARAFSLEQQVEHVIFNPQEFNTGYSEIVEKVKQNPKYATDFKDVFDENGFDRKIFSSALASYVLSLKSFNSEFDKYVRHEVESIDASVKNGFNLFMGKANCATCHFAPIFSGLVPPFYSDTETEILGVLTNPDSAEKEIDGDIGRFKNGIVLENSSIYEKSFKTSTVRNVALTAPYFHNGAYKTLEEVIDFYDLGGGAGMGLDVKNQTLPKAALNLTDSEKKDLIAFMNSLTDNSFTTKINL